MKNIVVNYKVFSDKISDKKILLLSDLHNYPGGRKSTLASDIKNVNADAIVIAGDIQKADRFKEGTESQKNLVRFLSEISEDAPVILGLGNHDLYKADGNLERDYKELEKARCGMVYPLSNESVVLDGIRFTEFHPEHDTFSPAIQDSGRALLESERAYSKSDISIPENDTLLNFLVSHNHVPIAQARMVTQFMKFDFTQEEFIRIMEFCREISKYDIVGSGHKHNGYIPLSWTLKNPEKYMDNGYWEMGLEKNTNRKTTKIRPWIFKKTDLCRGTHYIGDSSVKIIELCDGSFYLVDTAKDTDPLLINEEEAYKLIKRHNMLPIVISGGVNKYFGLPIDKSEMTAINLVKKM